MRGVMFAAAGFAAALAGATSAAAESPWYLEGSVGGYFRTSQTNDATFYHLDTPSVTVPGTDRLTFDPGVIVNLGVGQRLTPHVRLEAEVGYFSYNTSTLNPFTTAPGYPTVDGQTFTRRSGAHWTRLSGTVNAFYDFDSIAGRFTPYVGGGVGAADDRKSAGVFVNAAGQPFTGSGGSSTEGFGQLEGGVSIALSPHWALVPAYRYVRFFAGNEDVAHVAKVGLRYSF